MARWIVAGLFIVNILLGVGIYQRLGERTANAQIGKHVAQLATVAGQSNNQSIVYILDVNTGALAAIRNDVINKQVVLVAQRNVAADMQRIR